MVGNATFLHTLTTTNLEGSNMAYSDYTTLQKLNHDLGIGHKKQKLFVKVVPISPSERLIEDLEEAQNYFSLTTEKAKSEFLITPILKEVKRTHVNQIGVFSGVNLDLPDAGLSGFCDFILTRIPNTVEPIAPIFCLVEAKNRTLEEGFAQCAAEMYAAILFNEQDQNSTPFMYGCVTNGYEWCFLKLENQVVQIDVERFFLNDLTAILGIFQMIIESYNISTT
jgi:hypothetical protein